MKGLPGYFLGVVVLLFLSLLGTSLITGCIMAESARDFHISAVSQIENSNFNPEVIQSLYAEADRKGYKLEPIKVQEIVEHKKMCQVILKYRYGIGVLQGVTEEHVIRGYAR